MSGGWGANADGDPPIVHVFPMDDWEPHDLAHELENGTLWLHCWCQPCYVNGQVIHHSADHREDSEPDRHVCNAPVGEA
jgi:hypothetical protein